MNPITIAKNLTQTSDARFFLEEDEPCVVIDFTGTEIL